ncbi:MAG TPA: hypothetical protein VFT74_04710, partial [Isosphaeraceae bacterium]|nr:hypothetical protein [Isosphaeraceae bacterium]
MASSVYPHEMTRDVSWTGYLEFLDSPEYHRPRYTYDGRDLEIYTTTLGEGSSTSILDGLVARLCVELGLGFWTSRSTFYSCSRTKGLRPDICFWFGTERLVRGQKFTSPEDVPRPE